MKSLYTGTMFLALSACGHQLVEFAGTDGGGSGNPDGQTLHPDAAGARPSVISTGPANAATNVSVTKRIDATFSRAMSPATLDTTTFSVRQGANIIAGTVSYTGMTATFIPTNALDLSLVYTATITTGATDPTGSALAANYVWSFTTGACSLASVALLSTSGVAILAGSTVTNTGATTITGDLGVSPGTSVTGFPPGNLIGVQHAGDATAAVALGDLTTAYNDAAGRTLCALTVAGNLGGQTLTPGLYTSTSAVGITSGDLTLDAQGDADAVFIFQTASTLITTTDRQVILSGGARAANVFWQIGSSATLGSTSVFEGTIMADQTISIGTGATLHGRALARIAGVSLDADTIVKPAP
jgi:hypothetical protein